MTKRTGKTDKDTAAKGGIDPRLIELVRFLARRAAERDFAKAVNARK
ncbi:MAG: hypothetical protein ACFCUR_20725 [Rhodomicrobiaceae bacterium]